MSFNLFFFGSFERFKACTAYYACESNCARAYNKRGIGDSVCPENKNARINNGGPREYRY